MMYDVYGDYTHVCNYNNEKILEHLKLQPTYIFGTTGRRVTKKKQHRLYLHHLYLFHQNLQEGNIRVFCPL